MSGGRGTWERRRRKRLELKRLAASEGFVPWNGDYEKRPYEVLLPCGERVVCYPNAGRMHDMKTGRCWWPHEVVGVKPSTWDEYWKEDKQREAE